MDITRLERILVWFWLRISRTYHWSPFVLSPNAYNRLTIGLWNDLNTRIIFLDGMHNWMVGTIALNYCVTNSHPFECYPCYRTSNWYIPTLLSRNTNKPGDTPLIVLEKLQVPATFFSISIGPPSPHPYNGLIYRDILNL